MYTITILDKSKRILRTYRHITKIVYGDSITTITLEDDAILSHQFSLFGSYHFYSDTGNYTVTSDIIGVIEAEKEF